MGKKLNEVQYAIIGVGAANTCLIRTLIKAGVPPGNIITVDSKGILHPERQDIEQLKEKNPYKYEIAMKTNSEHRQGGIAEALKGVDVCVAASKPGPGTIKKEWAAAMNDDSAALWM